MMMMAGESRSGRRAGVLATDDGAPFPSYKTDVIFRTRCSWFGQRNYRENGAGLIYPNLVNSPEDWALLISYLFVTFCLIRRSTGVYRLRELAQCLAKCIICICYLSEVLLAHLTHHGRLWTLASQAPFKEWALIRLLGFKACKLLPTTFICLAKRTLTEMIWGTWGFPGLNVYRGTP